MALEKELKALAKTCVILVAFLLLLRHNVLYAWLFYPSIGDSLMTAQQDLNVFFASHKVPTKSEQNAWQDSVSVAVKTMERPGCIARLIKSICAYYPRVQIVVVDDSRPEHRLIFDAIHNSSHLITWINTEHG